MLSDLYCGTGTIGLFVGGKSLVGVEINESAIHDANINKDLNNISNDCSYSPIHIPSIYFEDINTPEKINELDSTYTADGNNYNVGSVDKDGFIVRLFKLLYPGCETPFKYIRVVMCYGLMKMEDLIESNDLIPLSKNM